MVMIIISLVEYYNVKVFIFFTFLIPLCLINMRWLVQFFFFFVCFVYIFCFRYFFCWCNISYIFGCDYVSYGLILLRFSICVLIILSREGVHRFGYFPVFYWLFILLIIRFCVFRSIGLFSFYLFLRVD
jgi:NADH-ubiquinone oxidoreductase chain 4